MSVPRIKTSSLGFTLDIHGSIPLSDETSVDNFCDRDRCEPESPSEKPVDCLSSCAVIMVSGKPPQGHEVIGLIFGGTLYPLSTVG